MPGGGPPQLPASWSEGYQGHGPIKMTDWQYGLASTSEGSVNIAFDPPGRRMLMSQKTRGGGSVTGTITQLLHGDEGRMYNFMNLSTGAFCTYQNLPNNALEEMLAIYSFKNYTWFEDSEVDGESVQIFKDSTLDVAGLLSNSVPAVFRFGAPAPSPVIALKPVRISNDLVVRHSDGTLRRMLGSLSLPRDYWGQVGGFQGHASVFNFSSFQTGRPPASLFKLPRAWEPCRPQPVPPAPAPEIVEPLVV